MVILLHAKMLSNSTTNDAQCKRLLNGCKLKLYFHNTNKIRPYYLYVCLRLDQKFEFTEAQMNKITNCTKNLPNLELIYFVLSKQRIFDDSFDLENIATFLPDDIYTVKFRFIKGFDIDRFYTKNKYISIEFKLEFYFSKFEFYSTKKLINSCSDLKSTRQSIINGLFHNHVYFYKSNYKSPICLLLLRNCSVRTFGFEGFINTFYKTNVLSFEPILDMNIITNEGDIS